MDLLTENFFNNSFPGLVSQIAIESDLLSSNFPIVDVKLNIDTSLLLDIADKISMNQVLRPIYPYEEEHRMQGWEMKTLWSDGTVIPWINDLYYKKFSPPVESKIATDKAKEIQNKLSEYGIDAKICWLSKFHPGGYLRPHRDIGLNIRPLSYFWIPLNDPAGSELKIYPVGTVDVNLGSMYLLNQENYVHGIINKSNQERYALLGHLSDQQTYKLSNKIQQAFRKLNKEF